jgi:hypothetical protein
MCLVSRRTDDTPNPLLMIRAQLMEMPMTHRFALERHQVRYDCPIFKKPQIQKRNFAINSRCRSYIKSDAKDQFFLFREHNDIFYKFHFGCQHQTCLSAIILKHHTIDGFILTQTAGITIDNNTTGTFDRVINGIALIAIHSLGFP